MRTFNVLKASTTYFVASAIFAATQLSGATVTVTPGDPQGWSLQNQRVAGTGAITAAYPLAGDGSLQFTTSGSPDKADFALAANNLLSSLSALSVDLYRDSSSTSAAHLQPAVRLFVDNGQATDRYSYLIWEGIYNGVSSVPGDTWTTNDLLGANFWQRAFKTVGGGQTIENYNITLAQWLSGDTFTGGGNTSNVVGSSAQILGFEIGVGSGWSGTFVGAADLFTVGFNGSNTTYNFETDASAAPEPATFALAGLAIAGIWSARKRMARRS